MKRLLAAVLFTFLAGTVWAAGSSVTTSGPTFLESQIYTITYSWVGDDGTGAVPATAGPEIEGWVIMAVTDPGATPPTDDYDIVLADEDGADVFGGELSNRDLSTSEQAMPKIGNTYAWRYVKGTLTLTITNQTDASATGDVIVYVFSDRER